ncbi:SDR family NAD(P)-dependent oxidoreductase [Chachezhania sediminis]|uniref:SDR family NAD(P)-dependent oxidoreductase n=1 Tax=Chachezhania sediminis TaxID=2599291 RepID=UPI00131D11CE|nr:SDR family NAD(P)-dependent oxidoreductase [Chachezhania sediminis]
MRLEGTRIAVTGASRGIGRALVLGLLARGAGVVAIARDGAALAALPGERVERLTCDLADPVARTALIEQLSDGRRLDGLINNAGIQIEDDLTAGLAGAGERIETELAVNLAAPMHLSAGLLPVLGRGPQAVLVNVNSGLALAPKRSAVVYCASKAGLGSFTRGLRYQVEDAGLPVRVIDAVMPLVATDMTAGRGAGKIMAEQAAEALLSGVEAGQDEIWIGKARSARVLHRLAPGLLQRMLRNG